MSFENTPNKLFEQEPFFFFFEVMWKFQKNIQNNDLKLKLPTFFLMSKFSNKMY